MIDTENDQLRVSVELRVFGWKLAVGLLDFEFGHSFGLVAAAFQQVLISDDFLILGDKHKKRPSAYNKKVLLASTATNPTLRPTLTDQTTSVST